MTIKRQRHDGDDARFYPIRENEWYKSYTTVLSMLPPSKFFIKWLKEHTAEEGERLMKAAARQGSKIHHAIDLILNGEEVSSNGLTDSQVNKEDIYEDDLKKYFKKPFSVTEDKMMRGFLNFVKDHKLEKINSEFKVWSDKLRCAGTCDFYGSIELPEDGKKIRKLTEKQKAAGKVQEVQPMKRYRAIIDWKTGKGVYDSHYMQVSGYFMALKEMIANKLLVSTPVPQKAFLLHLGVNKCGYKLIEIDNIKDNYRKFCRTNEIWEEANPNAKPSQPYEFLEKYSLIINK